VDVETAAFRLLRRRDRDGGGHIAEIAGWERSWRDTAQITRSTCAPLRPALARALPQASSAISAMMQGASSPRGRSRGYIRRGTGMPDLSITNRFPIPEADGMKSGEDRGIAADSAAPVSDAGPALRRSPYALNAATSASLETASLVMASAGGRPRGPLSPVVSISLSQRRVRQASEAVRTALGAAWRNKRRLAAFADCNANRRRPAMDRLSFFLTLMTGAVLTGGIVTALFALEWYNWWAVGIAAVIGFVLAWPTAYVISQRIKKDDPSFQPPEEVKKRNAPIPKPGAPEV
jgi:hypothetical protein